MAYPTLTPSSNTSRIVLPSTGNVNQVITAVPLGVWTGSAEFITGAAKQVPFTYRHLAGDVVDIELTTGQVYTAYETAVMEYSYIFNIHQAKNSMSSLIGSDTGTFDHKGEKNGGIAADDAELKLPKYSLGYLRQISYALSSEAGVGGNLTEYSSSVAMSDGVQDYDLQAAVASSSYGALVKDKKILIKRVYYKSARAMWRFFGYYGGINVVGNMSTYGQFSDDMVFEVVPAWQNKLQAMAFEDSLYTRTSHFSYEIKNNKVRVYPTPSSLSQRNLWFTFVIPGGPFEEDEDRQSGVQGVNNMNTLPFSNLPYENINSIGKHWIRRYALAIAKEMLAHARGKILVLPYKDDNITLNYDMLASQAEKEKETLREELKDILDDLTYEKLAARDAAMAKNTTEAYKEAPFFIYQL